MNIHLADTSSERGQYKLLTSLRYRNSLFSYAYKHSLPYFENYWNGLLKIHFATTTHRLGNGDETRECLITENALNHLFSYAYNGQEKLWRDSWNHAMKIHLAGHSATPEMENKVKPEHDAHLSTYADQKEVINTVSDSTNSIDLRPRVIIDSGAFTAWSTGKTIHPKEYAEWALDFDKRWRSKFATLRYINLDYIPGKKGISATPEELKTAVIRSQQNADFLRASGLSPVIEVFHQDEPFELLKTLNDRRDGGCIALSPRNDVSLKRREEWLHKVLGYCIKTFGKNNIPPCHGLAVTSEKLLKIFPFFSADSSSWVGCLRFGGGDAAGLKKLPRYKESDAAMSATIHTLRAEIRKYKKIEYDMTNLWRLRGIEWDEFTIR